MNTAVMFSSEDRELCTPDDLFHQLDQEFKFEVDACASEKNALCPDFFTDCLSMEDWGERVCWMNPPYGDPETPCKKENCKKKRCEKRGHCIDAYVPGVIDFVRKAEAEAKKGCTVVCLLPMRTDTAWWGYCAGHERREIKGRLKFLRGGEPVGTAPFPSVIVIMRPPATEGPYQWTRVMPVC